MEHGVPLFLSQLATALDEEQARNPQQRTEANPPLNNSNIAESAALHGQSLRNFGFTIEQVVHDYGDVCQAVTELADERGTALTISEFHTLNWCLDNAIAGAVTSWNNERDKSAAKGKGERDLFRIALSNILGTATVSFNALRAGRVGTAGATANILERCLREMRTVLEDTNWVEE